MNLYFEMYSGVAGDMLIGALLDLGADRAVLEKALASMSLGEYRLVFEKVMKNGVEAYHFDVLLPHTPKYHQNLHGHDHDGHSHIDVHEHSHDLEHTRNNKHTHNHKNEHAHLHGQNHGHRNLQEIIDIIHSGDLSPWVKEKAIAAFTLLGEAEAAVHGVPIEEIHFHEVGAIDSIIDIVGICVLIENLGPEHIYSSDFYEGTGFTNCAHGVLPVPVPAVVRILEKSHLSLHLLDEAGEHITPTGAVMMTIFSEGKPKEAFTIRKIGMGAGNKNFVKSLNCVRLMAIESSSAVVATDEMLLVETNIDDSTAEVLGYVMEQLQRIAQDVYYTPIYMKKNRPAYSLSVLVKEKAKAEALSIIFRETTTIGLRIRKVERCTLNRQEVSFDSSLGTGRLKVVQYGGETFAYPEYEDMKILAMRHAMALQDVYELVVKEYKEASE